MTKFIEISFQCPHLECHRESALSVEITSDGADNYSATCPHCQTPSMMTLPGKIVAGPFPIAVETR
jgi:hypothetical protein